MFCITYLDKKKDNKFYNDYVNFLDSLELEIVGAGGKDINYPDHWQNDSTGENISNKNTNYAALTVFYWIWKNKINHLNDDDWIGLCHYRRFWLKSNHEQYINEDNLKQNLLRDVFNPNLEAILNYPQTFENIKLSKIIKKGYKFLYKNPSPIFFKKKRTVKFHFDLFHINNGLDKSISLLETKEQSDFYNYITTKTEIYPNNIFIIKKKYFVKLCVSTFEWIEKCNEIFDIKKLKGYGETRIFDFLAERYYSYWISKYCNFTCQPHIFFDLRKKNSNILQVRT
ncbi:uncharacterized protein DUF4422 [Candidatus Pelagibacter ubique HIMB4]